MPRRERLRVGFSRRDTVRYWSISSV